MRTALIRSLFRFASFRYPEHAALIGRLLSIPPKRADRAIVTFLTDTEIAALLASPDRATRIGWRDHTLVALAIQTGPQVSELVGLTCGDVELGAGAHVRCHGKGRKEPSPRSADLLETSSASGSRNGSASRAIRSSPDRAASGSAVTPWAGSSLVTSSPPRPDALHSPASR